VCNWEVFEGIGDHEGHQDQGGGEGMKWTLYESAICLR
jgi:hypothetical protein